MLMTKEKRHPFWDALRRLAPDLAAEAKSLGEVRRRLLRRLDALVDRPLDDDAASLDFRDLGKLYLASFEVRP